MKRWGILVLGAAALAAGGWTAPHWLPPVLEFLGTQGSLIQSASAAVQMIGVAGGVLTALWALLRRRPVTPSVPVDEWPLARRLGEMAGYLF